MMLVSLTGSMNFATIASPAMDRTPDQCSNPTATIGISAMSGDKFNASTLNVAKNTCVRVFFKDTDTEAHSFVIDADSANNFVKFDIGLENNTDNGGIVNSTMMTPNKDITYTFYCDEPGHQAAGMEGKLIVGNGTPSSPGFEAIPLLLGTFVLSTILISIRKKQKLR